MNKKFYLLIGAIVVAIALVIGTSYAYFMATVTGGDSGNEIVIKSGNLSLTLTDNNSLTLNGIPGDSASKEFTVTNNGSNETIYNIKMVDVTNTFVDKNDLVYTLVGDNDVNITETVMPSTSDEYLATNITIGSGDTHTYTLTITFKETNDNQDDNKGATFSGKINIDDEVIKDGTSPVQLLNTLYSESNPELVVDDYDNIRYIGADPANYIYFNCDDYNNPSDSTCEKWRIIGSFKDIEDSEGQTTERVKIMRDEFVSTSMAWDESDDEFPNGSNNWATATLNTYLNGEYYNSLKNDITKNMIDSVVWNLGGSSTYGDVTAKMFYERERGTTVYGSNPTTWTGKIALMYPSDYGYATSGGSTTSREACLNKELFNWSSVSDCKNNDYIFDSSTSQWTLTHRSSNAVYAFRVSNYGYASDINASSGYGVRPVLYLESSTKIISGDGSEASPFVPRA